MARKLSRLNGAVIIGLVLLYFTYQDRPKTLEDLIGFRPPDFISEALWSGCKMQAVRRLKARLSN